MKNLLFPCIFLVFILGLSNFASGEEKKSYSIEDRYVFLSSNLQAENVSRSYAKSIYERVQDIIYGYVGAGTIDRYSMFSMSPYMNDFVKNNPTIKTLKLACYLVRKEDTSLLSVVIQDDKTSEEYLNAQYTSSFFELNNMLRDFASSFPKEFKLPIISEYNYVPQNLGYSVKYSIMLDDVTYRTGNCLTKFDDLVYDLRMSENIPQSVFREIKCYTIKRNIYGYTFWISGLANLSTLFIAGFMPHDKEHQQPAGIVYIASGAVFLIDSILLISHGSSKVEKILNEQLIVKGK